MKKPIVSLANYFESLMWYRRVKKMSFGEAAKQAQKDIKDNIRKQVRQEARKEIIEEIREYTEENRWWVMDESRDAIELNPFLFFLDSLEEVKASE